MRLGIHHNEATELSNSHAELRLGVVVGMKRLLKSMWLCSSQIRSLSHQHQLESFPAVIWSRNFLIISKCYSYKYKSFGVWEYKSLTIHFILHAAYFSRYSSSICSFLSPLLSSYSKIFQFWLLSDLSYYVLHSSLFLFRWVHIAWCHSPQVSSFLI